MDEGTRDREPRMILGILAWEMAEFIYYCRKHKRKRKFLGQRVVVRLVEIISDNILYMYIKFSSFLWIFFSKNLD